VRHRRGDRHKIDEILRELHEDGDMEKSVEKVDDLRKKVSEALGEGRDHLRSSGVANRRGLLRLREALGAEQ
jgi:hypothetical protein